MFLIHNKLNLIQYQMINYDILSITFIKNNKLKNSEFIINFSTIFKLHLYE